MEELLNKMSSYEIFNNLLPGVLSGAALNLYFGAEVFKYGTVFSLFIFYFFGVLVSRIGSLIIQPIMLKFKLIKFSDYDLYVKACREDKKISNLVEISNMYRSLLAADIAILFLVVIFRPISGGTLLYSIFGFVLVGLILIKSYIKANSYVVKRVNIWNSGRNMEDERNKSF